MYFPTNHFPGSMFSAVVLLLSSLLQRQLVTTQGHPGTNCYVFNAVHMDGGITAVRALAKQHGLEFIQQVSARLNPPHVYLNWWACNLHILVQMMFFSPSVLFCVCGSCKSADFYLLFEKYLTFIKLQRRSWILHIWSKTLSCPCRGDAHVFIYSCKDICLRAHVYMQKDTHTKPIIFFSCEKSLYDSVGLLPVLLCFF